jgi:hypothetical protein
MIFLKEIIPAGIRTEINKKKVLSKMIRKLEFGKNGFLMVNLNKKLIM